MALEAKDLLFPLVSIIVMFIPVGDYSGSFPELFFQVEENKGIKEKRP